MHAAVHLASVNVGFKVICKTSPAIDIAPHYSQNLKRLVNRLWSPIKIFTNTNENSS